MPERRSTTSSSYHEFLRYRCNGLRLASSADQLRRNARAVGWKLTEEDRQTVDALLEEIRNPGEVPFNKLPAA